MGFGGHKRFICATALVTAAFSLAACRDWDPNLDPPRVTQLACGLIDGSAPETRIYVLDTGAGTAVQVNGGDERSGRLTVTETAYRFDLAGQRIEVNRFDGRMTEETLRLPSQQAGPALKVNPRRKGTCTAQAEGPKL